MPYKPFPILDMSTGQYTRRDPWISPKDAFETLSNCTIKRGVLEKRKGYTKFGQIVVVNTATKVPALSTNPVMGIFNHLTGSTEMLIVFDQDRMNTVVSSPVTKKAITVFTDAGGGLVNAESIGHGLTTDDIGTITVSTNFNDTYSITKVNNDNFTFPATWVSTPGETGLISQERFEDATRNKIRYVGKVGQNWTPAVGETVKGATSGATGVVELRINDSGTIPDARGTLIFANGGVTGTFQDNEELQEDGTPANIAGQSQGANSDDAFTGDNTNFFQIANWNDITYLTNNKDPLQKYDGSQLTRFTIDLDTDGGAVNSITRCLLIFIVKERVVIFSTTESTVSGTTVNPQRARWSTIKDPDTWPSASFKDAPTQEAIVGGGFIGDDLYIWFDRSVWRFAYTGDSTDPFEWERVSDVEGCIATPAIVTIEGNRQVAVGPNAIIGNDGRLAIRIDAKIPDVVLSWQQQSLPYSYGLLLEQERQTYLSYASSSAVASADGNVYPDSVLSLNYEDNNWGTHKLPVHSMGLSSLESDITWETDDAWEDIELSWNSGEAGAGFPITLMGDHVGVIFQLNSGGSDDENTIEFIAKSARLNPYTEQGKKAKLGFIDFLVDVDPNISFDVKSYINTDSTPFQTKTVTCTAVNGSDDKARHRVKVMATAAFHRIEITNNASANRPRIHEITPYFEKSGGRLIG